jgi:hypothetical protein
VIELARQYGRYGCRKIAALLRQAGCAPSTGSAGHASASAAAKLTLRLDHSMKAGQRYCCGICPLGDQSP